MDVDVEEVMWYCAAHGIALAPPDVKLRTQGLVLLAPVSLRPCRVPRQAFRGVEALSHSINHMVDAVARDHDFLMQTLQGVASQDPFTASLLDLLPLCDPAGVQLSVIRSDYMLQESSGMFKQVEVNTVASSLAGLGHRVAQMHQYLEGKREQEGRSPGLLVEPTEPWRVVSQCMATTHQRFVQQYGSGVDAAAKEVVAAESQDQDVEVLGTVLLYIVQPVERNMVDQKDLQFHLEDLGVQVIRRTLKEVQETAILVGPHKHLMVPVPASDDPHRKLFYRVSVVYFRAGYTPTDYPTEEEWKARALLQSSSAVQCPTVAVQLAGTKKVQQVLGKREVLRRFLDQSSPDLEKQVDDMTSCFMGMYALEDSDEETLCALQRAVENPDDFLLKPQREGGGNLVYGEDLRTRVSKALQSHQQGTKKAEELGVEFTLMERIVPVCNPNGVFLREGQLFEAPTISEIGIFSCILSEGATKLVDEKAGYLVRTKTVGTQEGGMATGASCVDSLSLFDAPE